MTRATVLPKRRRSYCGHIRWRCRHLYSSFVAVGAVLTTLALMYQTRLLRRDDDSHQGWNVASWPQQKKQQLKQLQPHHHTKTNNNISIVNEKKKNEFIGNFTNYNNRSKSSSSLLYRWDDPVGIRIESLWQYMQNLIQETLNPASNNPLDYYSMNGPIPAFVDSSSTFLVASQVYGRRHNVRKRFYILEPFLQQTLSLLLSSKALNHNYREPSFFYLRQALHHGGLPLIILADDFTGCLQDNYNYTTRTKSNGKANGTMAHTSNVTTITTTTTIPFFTLSFSPSCPYAFAIPSYAVLQLLKPTSQDWNVEFEEMDQRYPWKNKKRQAVWRGALSGLAKGQHSVFNIPRIQLFQQTKNKTHLFDVALACQSQNNCLVKKSWKPYVMIGNYMDLDDFQTYRAVIDIDGNSWSERFPRLLCRNSVVVKIQPEQVDYFWSTLQAGVHYIATNISHLVEAVQYALDPDHEDEMQRMVANARHWCRQRMVVQQVQLDALSILNGYAELLYQGDPQWYRHLTKASVDQMKFKRPAFKKKKPQP